MDPEILRLGTPYGKNEVVNQSFRRQPRLQGECFVERVGPMDTIKTASFEYLIGLAKPESSGGYVFTLDGTSYHIDDVLEISRIAGNHGYIVIY